MQRAIRISLDAGVSLTGAAIAFDWLREGDTVVIGLAGILMLAAGLFWIWTEFKDLFAGDRT
jgi:hypothetical protein